MNMQEATSIMKADMAASFRRYKKHTYSAHAADALIAQW